MMLLAAHPLVHVNATLNATAAVLLVIGLVLIQLRRETAHKRVMLAAFAVSIVFLGCYLYYHSLELTTPYRGEGLDHTFYYYFLLPSHVILAMAVPVLAIFTIVHGLRAHGDLVPKRLAQASDTDRQTFARHSRAVHRRWARITFPIWLYVSVTGVLVYLMLYHWQDAAAG